LPNLTSLTVPSSPESVTYVSATHHRCIRLTGSHQTHSGDQQQLRRRTALLEGDILLPFNQFVFSADEARSRRTTGRRPVRKQILDLPPFQQVGVADRLHRIFGRDRWAGEGIGPFQPKKKSNKNRPISAC
jgi:hypothetical protein